MRIRKHAKISPLLYASSSLNPASLLQTHVCQLNQSPWDVMTFSPPSSPPPPPQSNGSGAGVGNGSSECFSSVDERGLSSRRLPEYYDAATLKMEEEDDTAPPPVKSEGTIICCKTDGKSWQCRREAAEGNSLCQHHLSLAKSYSNVGHHHPAKKSVKPAAEAQRRSRPKKPPATSSSNSYEFYYYSGFGPKWGKRRGGETRKNSNGCQISKNVGDANAEVEVETDPAAGKLEHLDFFEYEDDDDEDEDEIGDNGRKRVRKPIKARSLKSLL